MKYLALLLMLSLPSVGQNSLTAEVTGRAFSEADAGKTRLAGSDSTRASRAVLPHLAIGGPWKTVLTALNVSTTPGKAVISVYDPEGYAMILSLLRVDTGQILTGDRFTITLGPGASMQLIAAGGTQTRTGWMKYEYVTATEDPNFGGRIAIQETFRATMPVGPDMESSVLPDWALDKKVIVPYDNTGGFQTAIALVNAWKWSPHSLIITIYDEDGRVLNTRYQTLYSGQQRAFQTADVWPETRNRRGAVMITTDQFELGTLSLIFNPTGAMSSSQFYAMQ